MEPKNMFLDLLASLRALVQLHQSNHWSTASSYQHHLLFDTVRGLAEESVDALAEKAIALSNGDSSVVNAIALASRTFESLKTYYKDGTVEERIEASLTAELDFIDSLEDAAEEASSVGLQNLLSSIADVHERIAYLLGSKL